MIDWDKHVLTPLMANNVFGEPIDYVATQTNTISAINGVFDEAYLELMPTDDGNAISTLSPVCGIQLSLLNGVMPRQKDRLTRIKNGKEYVVKDVQPDGQGHVLLFLNLVRS